MNWKQAIRHYSPCSEQEEKDQALFLLCMDKFDDLLTRSNEIAHITSSAFVVNKERNRVLMVHHNQFQSWSWTGGHADGQEDLLFVAISETKEETGIHRVRPLIEFPVSLDMLSLPGHLGKGRYVAPHLHLNLAYLLEADENEPLTVKPDENSSVGWIELDEIDHYSNEPHMKAIYTKIVAKLKQLQ